jgi:hypothetical protein
MGAIEDTGPVAVNTEGQMATECEHVIFARKLGEFRATLSETEQRVLDAMVLSACRVHQPGEVEGYFLGDRIGQPFAIMASTVIGLVRPSSSALECTWRGCIDTSNPVDPHLLSGL